MTQPALTSLTDDEQLFRNSVYEFADRDIRPLVRKMDDEAKMPRDLIDRLFELGVMGIEIPDEFGGSGATFFHSVLAVEALSRVDPSVGVLADVHNTLVINALLRWGNEQQKRTILPRLAQGTVGAYALSEAGSGSDAFALATRGAARGDRLRPQRPQALDHERQRGRPLHRLCERQPGRRLSRHHGVPDRTRHTRLHHRQEGRQAWHPRQQHVRVDFRRLCRHR